MKNIAWFRIKVVSIKLHIKIIPLLLLFSTSITIKIRAKSYLAGAETPIKEEVELTVGVATEDARVAEVAAVISAPSTGSNSSSAACKTTQVAGDVGSHIVVHALNNNQLFLNTISI